MTTTTTFFSFLITAYDRQDAVGQVARYVVGRGDYPHGADRDGWKVWMLQQPLYGFVGMPAAIAAIDQAWDEYEGKALPVAPAQYGICRIRQKATGRVLGYRVKEHLAMGWRIHDQWFHQRIEAEKYIDSLANLERGDAEVIDG